MNRRGHDDFIPRCTNTDARGVCMYVGPCLECSNARARKRRDWIGVDLDGTLAHYDKWRGVAHIGAPIPAMVERVKRWLSEGRTVKIMTARAAPRDDGSEETAAFFIRRWCQEHLGQELEVTCVKDGYMVELWDDRAVSVEENTGRALAPSRRGLGD